MSKLTSASVKLAITNVTTRKRAQRKGEDVAYALIQQKSYKFLTKSEKKRLNEMKTARQEELRQKEQRRAEPESKTPSPSNSSTTNNHTKQLKVLSQILATQTNEILNYFCKGDLQASDNAR
ncbi:hypothetical protein OH492_13550 [Vibrio chagasii]|nr:hypothetical protein [Vibrio chagasii]